MSPNPRNGQCGHCATDNVMVTTYPTDGRGYNDGDPIDLCCYCERTSGHERRHEAMTRVVPRMMHVLEARLRGGAP
jgi:hypothetical protein